VRRERGVEVHAGCDEIALWHGGHHGRCHGCRRMPDELCLIVGAAYH